MTTDDPATWARLSVYDVPTIGQDSTTVDYRVPPETWVLDEDGGIYGQPGDHIHGTRARSGTSLGVYDAENCPVCIANPPPAVDEADPGPIRQD